MNKVFQCESDVEASPAYVPPPSKKGAGATAKKQVHLVRAIGLRSPYRPYSRGSESHCMMPVARTPLPTRFSKYPGRGRGRRPNAAARRGKPRGSRGGRSNRPSNRRPPYAQARAHPSEEEDRARRGEGNRGRSRSRGRTRAATGGRGQPATGATRQPPPGYRFRTFQSSGGAEQAHPLAQRQDRRARRVPSNVSKRSFEYRENEQACFTVKYRQALCFPKTDRLKAFLASRTELGDLPFKFTRTHPEPRAFSRKKDQTRRVQLLQEKIESAPTPGRGREDANEPRTEAAAAEPASTCEGSLFHPS